MKILVVDDEKLVLWFLDKALRKSGHEVITVSNIADAYVKLGSEDIDILFIDLRMPDGDGRELLKKLSDKPEKPKIVVCSAFITSELEEELKNRKIFFLKKPFKLDELRNTLEKCSEP